MPNINIDRLISEVHKDADSKTMHAIVRRLYALQDEFLDAYSAYERRTHHKPNRHTVQKLIGPVAYDLDRLVIEHSALQPDWTSTYVFHSDGESRDVRSTGNLYRIDYQSDADKRVKLSPKQVLDLIAGFLDQEIKNIERR